MLKSPLTSVLKDVNSNTLRQTFQPPVYLKQGMKLYFHFFLLCLPAFFYLFWLTWNTFAFFYNQMLGNLPRFDTTKLNRPWVKFLFWNFCCLSLSFVLASLCFNFYIYQGQRYWIQTLLFGNIKLANTHKDLDEYSLELWQSYQNTVMSAPLSTIIWLFSSLCF